MSHLYDCDCDDCYTHKMEAAGHMGGSPPADGTYDDALRERAARAAQRLRRQPVRVGQVWRRKVTHYSATWDDVDYRNLSTKRLGSIYAGNLINRYDLIEEGA